MEPQDEERFAKLGERVRLLEEAIHGIENIGPMIAKIDEQMKIINQRTLEIGTAAEAAVKRRKAKAKRKAKKR